MALITKKNFRYHLSYHSIQPPEKDFIFSSYT